MTDALTARQTQILKCIIDEYIETAEPVGSDVLEKKHGLGVSSATIRNEMATLTNLKYLKQPHTSAGRVPTPRAMKFYVDQLMEEKQMSLAEEVKAKEEVWDSRDDIEDLIEEATNSLAARTDSLAVAALDDGRSWHAGLANVFQSPEFADLGVCSSVFSLLEEETRIIDLFFKRLMGDSSVEVIFGEELGWDELEPVGVVATRFKVRNRLGALGIVGPVRLKYQTVIPIIRYYGKLIQEVAK